MDAELPARPAPRIPPAPLPPKTLVEEVFVVLSLSLLQDAVFAIIALATAPVAGIVVAAANQQPIYAEQLASFVFSLAPVWLVLYLVRRDGESPAAIGLAGDQPSRDAVRGVLLFAIVGLAGLGLYLAAVALGVNRFVDPAPPLGHWWTMPQALLNSAEAALLEEIVVVAYLITRLQQLRLTTVAAIACSALLRGSYHLYQGWGGFLGNLAMGVLFGWLFVRTRRTWPLVVAHFLLDLASALGFIAFHNRLPGFN